MKKFKILVFGIGLMLSIVTVFAKPAPLTNYGWKVDHCGSAIPVDEECQSAHSGATCQIDFVDMVVPEPSCDLILKRPNKYWKGG